MDLIANSNLVAPPGLSSIHAAGQPVANAENGQAKNGKSDGFHHVHYSFAVRVTKS